VQGQKKVQEQKRVLRCAQDDNSVLTMTIQRSG